MEFYAGSIRPFAIQIEKLNRLEPGNCSAMVCSKWTQVVNEKSLGQRLAFFTRCFRCSSEIFQGSTDSMYTKSIATAPENNLTYLTCSSVFLNTVIKWNRDGYTSNALRPKTVGVGGGGDASAIAYDETPLPVQVACSELWMKAN